MRSGIVNPETPAFDAISQNCSNPKDKEDLNIKSIIGIFNLPFKESKV